MRELTGLIIAFNERENIERTLAALYSIERIILVDSFSTDDTLALAKAMRPDIAVFQRAFDSFAEQCNFGLTKIETPWVLSIDADYVLSRELIDEIKALEPPAEINGYSAAFRYCVFGRPLRTTIYPPRTVLYRRDCARYENEGHGHRVRVKGPIASLAGKIDHDDRKPLSRWLQSQDAYFKIEARHLLAMPNERLNRQDRLRKKIVFAPWVIFLYLLIGRSLIFDGWPGWFYVFQRTIAEMLLSLRLLTEREHLENDSGSAEG